MTPADDDHLDAVISALTEALDAAHDDDMTAATRHTNTAAALLADLNRLGRR